MMNFRQTLFLICSGFCLQLFGQAPCGNPIQLNSVLISNTTCGNTSGTVIVTPNGGSAAFAFEWTPAVSSSNVATNLGAGLYQVHIVRANDPDCMLDTLIVVNNSNGPQVQAAIDPADCLASNGSVTLSPPSLLYSWSNGAGTNTVQGLASGNYYVTATNGSNGCFSVNKIFVPRSFAFSVMANVTKHAKCGQNIGSAQILVSQGSGQYSYSLGNGPVFTGLAAGTYTCGVTDNVTGCTGAVTFTIQNLPVTGAVTLSTHDVRCAGNASGVVDFQVTPGPNFQLPYVFTLVNTSGITQSPGNLAAGTYYLQVFDADNCPLTADTFTIHQPPPLVVTPQTIPETCANGGAITLNIQGGAGGYTVNWLDLQGDMNPRNRSNLEAGLYSVIVYDSLFCSKEVDNLLVAPNCNGSDTTFMVVKVGTTDVYCYEKPVGLASNATTYSLVGGGSSGSSTHGVWFLNPDGCLSYSAGATPGFAVDTVCIVRTASVIGLKDTLCLIVTITTKQPTKQSVFFTVQTNNAAEACGTIPPLFSHYTMAQIGRPGLSGSSDVYGQYHINSGNGCISFFANNVTGFSVDEIRVGVFDTVLNECHIICYLPSVIPSVDCATFIQLADTIHLVTNDCSGLATGCIPVPYDDIVNYTVIDNGVLYNAGYTGCDPEPTFSYNVNGLPQGGGPYQLTEWSVNGQLFSGTFLNLSGLAALLNQLNPGQHWAVQGANYIRGGNLSTTYGPLKVRSATGITASYDPQLQQVSMGTELRFVPGIHKVVFRNVLNACSDTVIVQADCVECQPIHNYAEDAQGNVVWTLAGGCAGDTIFCTNILQSDLGQYVITDNQQAFVEFISCGNQVGMVLDTGFHLLHLVHNATNCEYFVRFYLDCHDNVPSDSSSVMLALGEVTTLCLDTTLLGSPITGITNLCTNDGGSTLFGYQYNQQTWCVTLTGLAPGTGHLCLQLCNAAGQCANYIIEVTVSAAATDSLLAVPDPVFTLINTDVDIPILANDIVNGLVGNYFALSDVTFLTQPSLGAFNFNALSGLLTYSPNQGECGVDSFTYRITDSLGQQSAATITITIACDKVLVFNGISPNGDGKNDTWHILGIELFPSNEVHVFNRWGNQVFEQKGYTNINAWDGTWNGKDLPDGTYFYTLNLGGTAGRLEGFIQLLR